MGEDARHFNWVSLLTQHKELPSQMAFSMRKISGTYWGIVKRQDTAL